MVSCETEKPLSEPMMTQLNEIYLYHRAPFGNVLDDTCLIDVFFVTLGEVIHFVVWF